MKNAWRAALILLTSISCAATAQAQSSRTYRVGVLHAGGAYYHAVEGLRAGLKELGLQEGKQYTLDIRETTAMPRLPKRRQRASNRPKST